MKPTHAMLLILCATAFTSCSPEADQKATPANATTNPTDPTNAAPMVVRVTPLRRGAIDRIIVLPGTIVANEQAALCAKISGYLKRIHVDKGDVVKEGDLLAEIEAPELIADAAKFKADLEVAELEFHRSSTAQEKAPDLVMAQEVDAARAKYLVAKANLARADTLLGFCKISAPFAGTVTRRFVDPGAFIPAGTAMSGSQGTQGALLVVSDFSVVRLQVPVPEEEASLIRKEQAARVTIDELKGKIFPARVTRSSGALEENRTMLVEFDLPNPNGELLPGMYAKAKISIETHTSALTAPVEAVLQEKSGTSVFTVENGKARKIPVKTGFNDGQQIELLSGIENDRSVVVLGNLVLSDGQPVTISAK